MSRHPSETPWRLNGKMRASALQVAAKLARLEVIADLRYRDVTLEADAVDVTPCHETSCAAFYRFFVLRPVRWPAVGLPDGCGIPEEWRSEPISIPRWTREGLDAGLSSFETEFATYAFLQRVEREIDEVLEEAGDRMTRAGAMPQRRLGGFSAQHSRGARAETVGSRVDCARRGG